MSQARIEGGPGACHWESILRPNLLRSLENAPSVKTSPFKDANELDQPRAFSSELLRIELKNHLEIRLAFTVVL